MRRSSSLPKRGQAGFVLIASLLMLVVMTALAISLYHNFVIQENASANTKEKGRAFQLAQSTLQFAEYTLQQNAAAVPNPVNCTSTLAQNTITVCSNSFSITSPTSTSSVMSLASGAPYTTMIPAITISTTVGNNTYYANPQYYVQYLGVSPSGQSQIYQVTALAYGVTSNTVAVVQSTYALTSSVHCFTCSP